MALPYSPGNQVESQNDSWKLDLLVEIGLSQGGMVRQNKPVVVTSSVDFRV
jgi:hypothetical protein